MGIECQEQTGLLEKMKAGMSRDECARTERKAATGAEKDFSSPALLRALAFPLPASAPLLEARTGDAWKRDDDSETRRRETIGSRATTATHQKPTAAPTAFGPT